MAAVVTAREGRGPTESRIPLGLPSPSPLGNTTSVRMSVWPRLTDPAYYCTPTLLPRPVAFLGSGDSGKRRGRARRGRRFRCMRYPRRIAASMQFRALHTKLWTRGDADRSGKERRRGMDFIPRNVRLDSRQPPLLVKRSPVLTLEDQQGSIWSLNYV